MYVMQLIPLIAVAICGIYLLRKLLDTPLRLPLWDKVLSGFWAGSIVFLALSFFPKLEVMRNWYNELWYIIVFITLYLLRNYRPQLFDSSKSVSTDKVYALRNYYPARPLLIACLPVGVIYIVTNGLQYWYPAFYQKNVVFFTSSSGVAFFWMIGFGIYAVLQIKREQKMRVAMQEEARAAQARKAELEQLVAERTSQLLIQNEKLQNTLAELKSTQAQLIQSEKMASLGELTAGIAHEIQNPLNFVNNFSELNKELLIEMKVEMDNGNLDIAKNIAGDVIVNEEKINHHGKRADAIVKGMLQHTRNSSSIKEPTDINKLADEYLRLAYHGLRAKDKSFNAIIKTDYDESIGSISIIPQDMGRVILNLITNAFYAASLPSKEGLMDPGNIKQPTVTVSTSKIPPCGDRVAEVLISVHDNGPGVPQNIADKIFQPFFTTKPTGQGTGLGLSLAYDIVKAHRGNIKIETNETGGASFIIQLPVA
jgi:two-component system, NtrC family, sensor kinase